MHSPIPQIWELIIQSKDKKLYYIAYVELLTSQIFGDTCVQNAIGSILNLWFWVALLYETKPTFAVEMVYI